MYDCPLKDNPSHRHQTRLVAGTKPCTFYGIQNRILVSMGAFVNQSFMRCTLWLRTTPTRTAAIFLFLFLRCKDGGRKHPF